MAGRAGRPRLNGSQPLRLKRKATGWLMALARIAVLNPELFEAIAAAARTMYPDQTGDEYPWHLVVALTELDPPEDGDTIRLRIVRNDPAEGEAS